MFFSYSPLEKLGWSHVSGNLWQKDGRRASYEYAVSYELSKYAAEQSVHLTASGGGMLARFGHWLVRLGNRFIQYGGR